jgi:hypothetical protein
MVTERLMPAGITFKETVTGWFALGAIEAAAPERLEGSPQT